MKYVIDIFIGSSYSMMILSSFKKINQSKFIDNVKFIYKLLNYIRFIFSQISRTKPQKGCRYFFLKIIKSNNYFIYFFQSKKQSQFTINIFNYCMKLFMILIVLVFSTPSSVIYEFNANSQINDGWVIRDNDCFFYNCGGIFYFGQPLNDDNPIWISRLFSNLQDHSHILVEAKVLRMYTSDPFVIELDYITAQQSLTTSSSTSSVCSGSQ
ncbi:unnamed protein product, partial (macronuclear) [Paramecium tetraurelia]